MAARLDPRVSEFETEAQASSHDRWMREEVRLGLADSSPVVAHDDVMAEMDAIIEQAEQRHTKRR